MKVKVDKIRKVLSILEPVVPKKTTIPVCRYVLLREGKVVANNLEVAVSYNLSEANQECLLPHRIILEMLKFVPGDDMLTIEPDGKLVKFSWSDGKAVYPTENPRDFPPVPWVKEGGVEVTLDGDLLIETMYSMVPYAAKETTRPVLNGINLLLGDSIEIAAADGYRLAYKTLPLSFPSQANIIIPAATVGLLKHLWDKTPTSAPLANSLIDQLTNVRELHTILGQDKFQCRFGDVQLVSSLISGSFPNWKQLAGAFEKSVTVRFFGGELLNAVKRLRAIAKDGAGVVRLLWTDTSMTISSRSEECGEVEATIKVQPGSNPGRIAIDVKYLLEYFVGKDGLVTMMSNGDGRGPATFQYGNLPTVALMPMQANWGDEKPVVPNEPPGEAAEPGPTMEREGDEHEPGDEVDEPGDEALGEQAPVSESPEPVA